MLWISINMVNRWVAHLNLTIYRPRKFSFDPKLKKLFSYSEIEANDKPFPNFYENGRLVSNSKSDLELADTNSSDQPTLISFLKSELMSDLDNEDESMLGMFEQIRENIKSDEEKAYSLQCDPKMGPIFKIFQMDY